MISGAARATDRRRRAPQVRRRARRGHPRPGGRGRRWIGQAPTLRTSRSAPRTARPRARGRPPTPASRARLPSAPPAPRPARPTRPRRPTGRSTARTAARRRRLRRGTRTSPAARGSRRGHPRPARRRRLRRVDRPADHDGDHRRRLSGTRAGKRGRRAAGPGGAHGRRQRADPLAGPDGPRRPDTGLRRRLPEREAGLCRQPERGHRHRDGHRGEQGDRHHPGARRAAPVPGLLPGRPHGLHQHLQRRGHRRRGRRARHHHQRDRGDDPGAHPPVPGRGEPRRQEALRAQPRFGHGVGDRHRDEQA